MKYQILKEDLVFSDYLKVTKAEIVHDSFEEGKTVKLSRLAYAHGDAIAILIYEKDTDSFLLTNQFRYPTSTNGDAWMVEIPAGMVDKGEKPEDTARREAMEELGYQVKDLIYIGTYYSSPGSSTERVFTYYAEVTTADKIESGGGLDTEHEDIQLIKIPLQEAKAFLPEINDFKTMVAFQWYLLNKQ